MADDKLITIQAVAEILGLSISAAHRHATRNPDFPLPIDFKVPKKWKEDEIRAFAARHRAARLVDAMYAARHLLKTLSWVRPPLLPDSPTMLGAQQAYDSLALIIEEGSP